MMIHICYAPFKNRTYDAKYNFWLVTWANRRIFYLSFEHFNICIECAITKIQPLKAGQS